MVDSCSRVNGVFCTVARLRLFFLLDESGWIALGADGLHQIFGFEQFFNGKLCCKIHDLLSGPITFFLEWVCSVLSLDGMSD